MERTNDYFSPSTLAPPLRIERNGKPRNEAIRAQERFRLSGIGGPPSFKDRENQADEREYDDLQLEKLLKKIGAVRRSPGRRHTHWMQRVAKKLLYQTACDYYLYPDQREDIEFWMAGGKAALSFEDTCYLLHFAQLEPVKKFIRQFVPKHKGRVRSERVSTETPDNSQHPAGSLATDRVRRDGAGNPGPQWLFEGQGNLDRIEEWEAATLALPGQLAQAPHSTRGPSLGVYYVERQPSWVVEQAKRGHGRSIIGFLFPDACSELGRDCWSSILA